MIPPEPGATSTNSWMNQRPLGYEYNTAMPGNPMILRERRSTAGSSTFSVDASFLLLFRPVSGCYGSKMGADSARCVRHARDSRGRALLSYLETRHRKLRRG